MNEICRWTGASGTSYTYYIRPRGTELAPNQMGNYIEPLLTLRELP